MIAPKVDERSRKEIEAPERTFTKSLRNVIFVLVPSPWSREDSATRDEGLGTRDLFSQRTRNPSVFSHAPEMNRHQESGDQRDRDAVQHVEAQQRRRPDGSPADETEPRVVTGVNQSYVTEFYEPRHGALISRAGRRARHRRADCD